MNNLAHIKRHEICSIHKEKILTSKTMKKIDILYFQNDDVLKKKQVEMMCVIYCIQHALPFKIMDSLPKLILKVSPNSTPAQNIKCGRTKANEYINIIIGPFAAEKISVILRKIKFSIIIDETTDVTSAKCLVIIVRYFD